MASGVYFGCFRLLCSVLFWLGTFRLRWCFSVFFGCLSLDSTVPLELRFFSNDHGLRLLPPGSKNKYLVRSLLQPECCQTGGLMESEHSKVFRAKPPGDYVKAAFQPGSFSKARRRQECQAKTSMGLQ